MANPELFLAKAGVLPGHKKRVPSILQAIQMDTVKIKQISTDGLAPSLLKYEKLINRRPRLVLSESTSRKNVSTQPEIKSDVSLKHSILNKESALGIAESTKTLRKQHSENQITHGFRYHSNGDERLPRKDSENFDSSRALRDFHKFFVNESRDQFLESQFLPEYLQKNYSLPKLNKASADQLTVILDDIQQYYRDGFRKKNGDIFRQLYWLTDRRLAGKTSARHQSIQSQEGLGKKDNWMYKLGQSYFKDDNFFDQDRKSVSESRVKVPRNSRSAILQPAMSSFNMQYGVSSKLLASRKPTLDDCKVHELDELSKLNCEIDDYTKSVRDLKKNQTRT
ncbi:hypothetical protein Btru_001032 [Bulinus truncatus]|nr:hypothetical protein Btru_001032 [Bulinus truncatus]